jgi:hypothetical protein
MPPGSSFVSRETVWRASAIAFTDGAVARVVALDAVQLR